MMRYIVTLQILFSLSCPAFAEQSPSPGQRDQRIRSVTYQKHNVVKVYGTYGTSTMIIFSENEKFKTVSIGDSQSWEIVPSDSKNILFIKPTAEDVRTNMNVVTDKRIYHFDLIDKAPSRNQNIFAVRFIYPDQNLNAELRAEAEKRVKYPNIAKIDKDNINIDYSYTGKSELKPIKIFDDGKKTFIQFRKGKRVPAIFVVNSDYTETLVNFRKEGEYLVVDGEHTQFTLRSGKHWVCIFNLRKPDFGAPKDDITGPKKTPLKRRYYSGNKANDS